MLSSQQLSKIADKVNQEVDIPFIGEDQEKSMLMSVLDQINGQLTSLIPTEYHGLVSDTAQGLDAESTADLKQKLTATLKEKVNLGMLGSVGDSLINTVVSTLVDGMQKGKSI